ncbi:MAG: SIS domain-containing protein [Chitinophagia bacterium]|jgi:D-sedoheptulose 7-phosphate isomerase|nr:SIS domain-containing protein [Chitinophagia bacterium]
MHHQKISSIINESIKVKQALMGDIYLIAQIDTVVKVITTAFQNGNSVYFAGNGGSAADAQHLAAEFSGRFYKDRKALPSEALHCNTSYLTAVANDYSYEVIYARLIEGITKPGDVLVGISTSGNSGNIVKAFEMAKTKQVVTIGFTGEKGGKMKEISDYLINVPSNDTPRIQESHILVGHIICELVESNIFG